MLDFPDFCLMRYALAAFSLVFCPPARMCSLHHRHGYAFAREHAHAGKILRDLRSPLTQYTG